MKIRNRKKLNVIIASFMAVFLVGGAFAFVSQGPLVFQGTANIEARLQVEIMNGSPLAVRVRPLSLDGVHGGGELIPSFSVQDPRFQGFGHLNMLVETAGVTGVAEFMIPIQNTGTIPAIFNGLTLEYDYLYVHGHNNERIFISEYLTFDIQYTAEPFIPAIWHDANPPFTNVIDNLVLQPGEAIMARVVFTYDASDINTNVLMNEINFEARLSYEVY